MRCSFGKKIIQDQDVYFLFAIRYVYQIKQPLKKNIGKEYLAYKGLDEL